MNLRHWILFTGLSLAVASSAFSQSFLKASGKAIINESGDTVLLRGMGLGGWMLQEGYMLQTADFANAQYQIREKIEELIGTAATDLFYEAWLANHLRKSDIDSLKAWGFNAVRLPMHYNLFTLPVEDEPVPGQNTWLTKGFELTDSLISWCKQNEMYVILDLHAAPGGQGYDQGISDYDPTKPSLWESQPNRDKTVALWKKLAETYANEPTVAAYDLINEPNWNLPGNQLLRDLYQEITDSIRTVDTTHMLIIEGNWFANDFTGLTPPWDDNMAYGPHKYWSFNDQASIQWVLDIRDNYDVPIFFGESGENSNPWFADAVRLFEENGLGWAWWPLKKVESIAGPLSVKKPAGYQALLDYWSGNAPAPPASAAQATLMQLAQNLKTENCIFHKDVIDALMRQPFDETAIPYNVQQIPGVVYTTDFDMGVPGSAYYDSDLANYQVSTGAYTAWNNGWSYRNDGVDIESSQDPINSNGFSLGWLTAGEWMQYSVQVANTAVYDVEIRVAANGSTGRFHLSAGGADLTPSLYVLNTGGWQNWQTMTVSNVVLNEQDQQLRFHIDGEGFNLGSMKFIEKGPTNTLPALFVSAVTLDESTVQLSVNKPLQAPLPASPAGFSIMVDGNPVPVTSAELSSTNRRIITFGVNHNFKSSEEIRISYSGDQIMAMDSTLLEPFSNRLVKNTIAKINAVPGRVEAEDFFFQSGVQLENTSDVGGGQNIGYLDAGDYLDYYIDVAQGGTYDVAYRTAAHSETGAVEMQLIEPNGTATTLHTVSFAPTGGWQTWATTNKTLVLPQGLHQIRVLITQSMFNMNWFEFTLLTATENTEQPAAISLYPNPTNGILTLKANFNQGAANSLWVTDALGRQVWERQLDGAKHLDESLNFQFLSSGCYVLTIQMQDGTRWAGKIIIR